MLFGTLSSDFNSREYSRGRAGVLAVLCFQVCDVFVIFDTLL